MPSLKEIIVLVSVLLVSLIIVFSSPEQLDDKNKDIQLGAESSNNISIFKNKTKQSDEKDNQMQNVIPNRSQIFESVPILANNQEKTYQTNTDNIYSIIPLSLEIVLDEVKNLSFDLRLEFNKIRKQKENCPTCGQSEQSSDSVCATILASPGGGICSCASLGCLPEKGPTCVHPCCCVCCIPCCY